MKLAVITDSSAYLEEKTLQRENLFILDIPVNIDGEEYVEGVSLQNCLKRVNQVLLNWMRF